MPKFIYTNITGSFVISDNLKLIDKILFSSAEDYLNREKAEQKLIRKFRRLERPSEKVLDRIMGLFDDKQHYKDFCKMNIILTRMAVKESVTRDMLIIQAVNSVHELVKVSNILAKRLREWYSLHNPEFSESISDHKKFAELILKKDKETLLKELKVKSSMGADLKKNDLEPVFKLAKELKDIYSLIEKNSLYLRKIAAEHCPNITSLISPDMAALMIEQAGSLKKLMEMPASTVQLLGAEKALFRHLKNKKNLSPKYGFLFTHPMVQDADIKNKGRIARILADKISIAAKIDYFKGKFAGDELMKQVRGKIRKG